MVEVYAQMSAGSVWYVPESRYHKEAFYLVLTEDNYGSRRALCASNLDGNGFSAHQSFINDDSVNLYQFRKATDEEARAIASAFLAEIQSIARDARKTLEEWESLASKVECLYLFSEKANTSSKSLGDAVADEVIARLKAKSDRP